MKYQKGMKMVNPKNNEEFIVLEVETFETKGCLPIYTIKSISHPGAEAEMLEDKLDKFLAAGVKIIK